MLYSLLNIRDRKQQFSRVSAHCDIPCKIYDPITAQLAVLTMIRMVDLLEQLAAKSDPSPSDHAQFSRLVAEKETHGRKVKEEINVIWGDYIKQPQLDKFPELHELVHSIMLNASQAKQHISRDVCVSLLEKVNQFADIFWRTKGLTTYLASCPYPPSETLIYPKLA
ncbi:superoxide dismutase, Ni [Shewanella sp. D64]|uniref:superoxide dismutase, Ni n=1 Tax=unclassified Shewanella TaxID=196818 RepID=UPI0022BA2AAF|nr:MULTISPECIES: superoxide dismutase, Ni [unclassified Shewanella]MEC4727312.1 superoxide dismutase, Ni [Shewanella sp. D64]MEC4739467.1 superoxide dismutase, Ni [Shewanella sp. E94]WBJ96796.1 superoxide dismutase, Ni [Shewanella sp. MTB7]